MSDNQYKTKQKLMVYDCLKENSNKAMTADEIYENLKGQGVSVGRTTVYRHLDALLKDNKLRRFSEEKGKSATYQYIDEEHSCCHHLHIKCVSCGKLEHLSCDFMNEVCSHILKHHNFRVDNAKTNLLGLCAQCSGKEQTESVD